MNRNKFKNRSEFLEFRLKVVEQGSVLNGSLCSIIELQDIVNRASLLSKENDIDFNLYTSTDNYDKIQSIICDFSFVENPINNTQTKSIFISGVKINLIHYPEIKNWLLVPNLEFFEPNHCVTNI